MIDWVMRYGNEIWMHIGELEMWESMASILLPAASKLNSQIINLCGRTVNLSLVFLHVKEN